MFGAFTVVIDVYEFDIAIPRDFEQHIPLHIRFFNKQ